MNVSNFKEDTSDNNKKKEIDDVVINDTLQKIVKGSVFVFIGSIVGMLLAFVGRILFARSFNVSEYGIFSLSFALLSIFTYLAILGLEQGIARQIAYHMGKKQTKKVQSAIIWSLIFSVISGIIFVTYSPP